MKQLHLTLVLILSGFVSLHAQSSSENQIPSGFSSGLIVLADNTIHEGYVKNNMRKSGEVVFLSVDGRKLKYTASQLSGASVENTRYIVSNNAFYKVVADGTKLRLLRKASNSSSIQYNGSEPIASDPGEGNYDDYFIQMAGTTKLHLVRKKDFSKIFATICADCTSLTDDLKSNKLGFTQIEEAVTTYNACNK